MAGVCSLHLAEASLHVALFVQNTNESDEQGVASTKLARDYAFTNKKQGSMPKKQTQEEWQPH